MRAMKVRMSGRKILYECPSRPTLGEMPTRRFALQEVEGGGPLWVAKMILDMRTEGQTLRKSRMSQSITTSR
jgi:hypothetical protein